MIAVLSALFALGTAGPAAAEPVQVVVTAYQCPTATLTPNCFLINSAAISGSIAGEPFGLMSVGTEGVSVQAESDDVVVINVIGGSENTAAVQSSFTLTASAGSAAVTFIFVPLEIPPDPGGGGGGDTGADPGGGTGGDPGGGTGGEPGGGTGGDPGGGTGGTPGDGQGGTGGGGVIAESGGTSAAPSRAVIALPKTGSGINGADPNMLPAWLLLVSVAASSLALFMRPAQARLTSAAGAVEHR